MKTFIKKKRYVSETFWNLFPLLVNVFEKNKSVYNSMLDTLNHYIYYGKKELIETPERIVMLLKMAGASLNTTQPDICVNNAEGAILL